jgi:hypothetical protein
MYAYYQIAMKLSLVVIFYLLTGIASANDSILISRLLQRIDNLEMAIRKRSTIL